VREGDTLYSIARSYGTTVEVLRELNHIKNDNLIVTNRVLKIPPAP
jgi:LysM repeat protein